MGQIRDLQEQAWANKIAKDFNTTNVEREFNYTYAELAEAYESYRKEKGDVGEEIADTMIFLFGLARMLDVDIEQEVLAKMKINTQREYIEQNGHHIKKEAA